MHIATVIWIYIRETVSKLNENHANMKKKKKKIKNKMRYAFAKERL